MMRRMVGTVFAFTILCPAPSTASFSGLQDPARTIDRPTAPPPTRSATLGETTFMLDEVIERRSRELETAPPSGTEQRIVHDARRVVRRITVELAMLGRERGDAGVLAGLHAVRFDATMRSIDRLLGSLARPGTMVGTPPIVLPETDRASAIDRLDAFNRTALDLLRRSDTGTVEGLDTTLATVVAPLRDVLSVLTGHPLRSRWPIGPGPGPTAAPGTMKPAASPTEVRVMAMLEAARIHESTPSFDVTSLERMLSATPFDSEDAASISTWQNVAEILDCLREARGEETPLATSTLRPAQREASARRRTALQRLQRDLDAAADPASPVLEEEDLVSIRDAVRTSRAVRHLDAIAVGLARIHPAATRKSERTVATWSRKLTNPRERDRALEAIDRIGGDIDRYSTIEFEPRLRTPDAPAIDLTGGNARELSDAVENARRAWVDAVTNGDTEGPAFDAMDRMARLGRLLENLVPFVPTDDAAILDLERCDRWGGWYVDATTLGWSNRTLLPGVRLAVGSAIAGDPDRFERELAALESQSPLIRLAAVIVRRTEDTTAVLPGGGIATIAAAAIPPEPSAWGLDHRIALAATCVGMAELVASRRNPALDDPAGAEQRDRLARVVASACETLLAEMNPGVTTGKETRP